MTKVIYSGKVKITYRVKAANDCRLLEKVFNDLSLRTNAGVAKPHKARQMMGNLISWGLLCGTPTVKESIAKCRAFLNCVRLKHPTDKEKKNHLPSVDVKLL